MPYLHNNYLFPVYQSIFGLRLPPSGHMLIVAFKNKYIMFESIVYLYAVDCVVNICSTE